MAHDFLNGGERDKKNKSEPSAKKSHLGAQCEQRENKSQRN